MKSARVGYTKCLLAMIGYTAQHNRRNQAVWQPTDDDSDDFCKTEVETMLRDVRIMREVFPEAVAKSKANSLQQKTFLGSLLKLRGGKAAGNYRRLTIAVAIADEFSGFDQVIEKAADPWTLIHKRLEGAAFPKLIVGSTPRLRGLCHTEKRVLQAKARMQYQITCPHCSVEHPLMWGGSKKKYGIKWDIEDPENVRHVCPHCEQSITQSDYLKIWHLGSWLSDCGQWRIKHSYLPDGTPQSWWETADGQPCAAPEHVALHIWTAYSPQATWADIVREWLVACKAREGGDRMALQGFINETLGETWEDDGDKANANELQRRAEPYKLRTVPHGGLLLYMGVDVQDDRFECVTWAFGRNREMWVVDYRVIEANPADPKDWAQLDEHIKTPLQHANGPWMYVRKAAIDTGGHFTHQVYQWVYERRSLPGLLRIYGVKGDSIEGKTIKGRMTKVSVNANGRVIDKGLSIWLVGTDTAKDLIYSQFKLEAPGPGFMHFSADLPPDFYRGLTAEKRVVQQTAKGKVFRWVDLGRRNEPLDCTVYAIFCAAQEDIDNKSERQWRELEYQVAPSLLDEPPPQAKPVPLFPKSNPLVVEQQSSATSRPSPFASKEWLARMR
jgi:phage terminase large subunit GpA-like protein